MQLPVKKGWLKKQGGSNKVCSSFLVYVLLLTELCNCITHQAFKDRWFVMERGKLSYYKDEKVGV